MYPLTVHHLRLSQSERIVFLVEELGIPYNLKLYNRQESDKLAPADYRSIHWTGTAPVIEDKSNPEQPVTLAESGAIIEYILHNATYNKEKRLLIDPTDTKHYPDYVFWLNHANAGFQGTLMMLMTAKGAQLPPDNFLHKVIYRRLDSDLHGLEEQLSRFDYLAGNELTAADVMVFFSLTTMRVFTPYDLKPYPHIVTYLERVGKRDGYRRAMEKAEPGLQPFLTV